MVRFRFFSQLNSVWVLLPQDRVLFSLPKGPSFAPSPMESDSNPLASRKRQQKLFLDSLLHAFSSKMARFPSVQLWQPVLRFCCYISVSPTDVSCSLHVSGSHHFWSPSGCAKICGSNCSPVMSEVLVSGVVQSRTSRTLLMPLSMAVQVALALLHKLQNIGWIAEARRDRYFIGLQETLGKDRVIGRRNNRVPVIMS